MPTILIADDESPVRALLRTALESWGYSVLEAKDGEEALEILHRKPVDLAIVDLVMPRMDGLQLIRQLRLAGSVVRIVASAGWPHQLPEAIQAGADATTEKPIDLAELEELVGRMLAGAEQEGMQPS